MTNTEAREKGMRGKEVRKGRGDEDGRGRAKKGTCDCKPQFKSECVCMYVLMLHQRACANITWKPIFLNACKDFQRTFTSTRYLKVNSWIKLKIKTKGVR